MAFAIALISGECWAGVTATKVCDGDTIKVDRKKVRLIGVDSPENGWKEKGKKEQCYAKEATNFLKHLIEGKSTTRVGLVVGKKDGYRRYLAYVYVGDKLVNAELIKGGYGYAYTYFPFSKSKEFKKYHEEAKKAGHGMWSACHVERKWKFRRIE